MDDNNRNRTNENRTKDWNIGEIIIKILVSAIVIGVASFLTPGFSIENLWSLVLAAVVIGILNYLIQKFTGVHASPFGRGLTGFLVASLILYLTKFFVPGFNISVWGALIGALVIGIIDMIVPGDVF